VTGQRPRLADPNCQVLLRPKFRNSAAVLLDREAVEVVELVSKTGTRPETQMADAAVEVEMV